MSSYPSLSTQVIGQAESALGAILDRLLGRTGVTPSQWFVLTLTAAGGPATERAQLIARVAAARKLGSPDVEAAIGELVAAGLLQDVPGDRPRVGLTGDGRARVGEIRAAVGDVTARLFDDLPPEDLATAGRVLTIVTTRANAELAAK